MISVSSRKRDRFRVIAFLPVVVWVCFTICEIPGANAAGLCSSCYVSACPSDGSLECRAGDLQIHIVGSAKNIIEAYFQDNFHRLEVPETPKLTCEANVYFAKPSEYGAFAVRYGKKRDRFVAFAWEKQAQLARTPVGISSGDKLSQVKNTIQLDEGSPIRLRWITQRILKIWHGKNLEKTYILKFVGEDKGWEILYPRSQSGERLSQRAADLFSFLW